MFNQSTNCPYICTIKRHLLDFDFEKVCSVSLSTLNIYCCLICGKYYQGRGQSTHAYRHSMEEDHHLFINLNTEHIYCLPDDYEVHDTTLNDIKSNLKPTFTVNSIAQLDRTNEPSYSLSGKEFIPGCVGLNNLKHNDYVNVIIQALCHVKKLRNYFLLYNNSGNSSNTSSNSSSSSNTDYTLMFVDKLAELFRKMWNKNNFKEHISPHELLQVMSLASKKRFTINKQSDAIVFLSWLLNILNNFFNNKKPKRLALIDCNDNDVTNNNIIEKYFTGTLQVETFTLIKDDTDKSQHKHLTIAHIDGIEYFYTKHTTTFFYLSLDLPNTPLFKDSQEKINIPQISIHELLNKFSGNKFIEDPIKDQRRKYKILTYPKYLILVFKRFENNMFFIEKNPTIVNFASERLSFGDMNNTHTYNLIANVIHDGKPNHGTFRVQVLNKASSEWYEIQDLTVDKIMPQSVTVSESYIHFYELKKIIKTTTTTTTALD